MEINRNSTSKFNLGKVVQTQKISEARKEIRFNKEIECCLERYCKADFNEMSQDDIEDNKLAIENGDDEILGAYNTSFGRIYIITEHDGSCTTILFADEY